MAPPGISPETLANRKLPVLQHEEVHDEFGQYARRYVTADGTVVSERGRLVPTPDGQDRMIVIEGETLLISDDGKIYFTKYTAGLNGNRVEGTLPGASETEIITDAKIN